MNLSPSGNEFTERDRTSLFNIYKYQPERARPRESLFTETLLDSIIG